MKIISPRKTEVTIKRPNGTVETIIHPKIDYFTDDIFAQMRKAMADAGKGDVLSYRNIDAVVEMEDADYKTRCTRCNTNLDSRTAYGQTEWSRFGNNKVQVIAHYCKACHTLLNAMDQLDERAGHVPSYEPTHKEDY